MDPRSLERWLPPEGMTGRVERFDPRPGGGYRMTLTYRDPGRGKTDADTDVVEVGFVDLVPEERVVQRVVFASDDPAFAGTTTMTWRPASDGATTLVTVTAEDVPPGISPEDHAAGLASSPARPAAFVERG
ncbi:SRPBCC domain-containing protein [Nocardiopsis sp. N85]|uniref:SRPBCC domain-containing protein n=1 Tax=Nocardiopsis sp. N85 TaxID=3029400 RepID=UPI00237F1CD9|nr:SRPBCC domain-containing protein [Nocardiopsis sp. N85]MDE3724918.1 SRPBCC domain-containing protein [Nocardiopsis sp. N85]